MGRANVRVHFTEHSSKLYSMRLDWDHTWHKHLQPRPYPRPDQQADIQHQADQAGPSSQSGGAAVHVAQAGTSEKGQHGAARPPLGPALCGLQAGDREETQPQSTESHGLHEQPTPTVQQQLHDHAMEGPDVQPVVHKQDGQQQQQAADGGQQQQQQQQLSAVAEPQLAPEGGGDGQAPAAATADTPGSSKVDVQPQPGADAPSPTPGHVPAPPSPGSYMRVLRSAPPPKPAPTGEVSGAAVTDGSDAMDCDAQSRGVKNHAMEHEEGGSTKRQEAMLQLVPHMATGQKGPGKAKGKPSASASKGHGLR